MSGSRTATAGETPWSGDCGGQILRYREIEVEFAVAGVVLEGLCFAHYIFRPDDPADTALNNASCTLGRSLAVLFTGMSLGDVGNWIRVNICDPRSRASRQVPAEAREELAD